MVQLVQSFRVGFDSVRPDEVTSNLGEQNDTIETCTWQFCWCIFGGLGNSVCSAPTQSSQFFTCLHYNLQRNFDRHCYSCCAFRGYSLSAMLFANEHWTSFLSSFGDDLEFRNSWTAWDMYGQDITWRYMTYVAKQGKPNEKNMAGHRPIRHQDIRLWILPRLCQGAGAWCSAKTAATLCGETRTTMGCTRQRHINAMWMWGRSLLKRRLGMP